MAYRRKIFSDVGFQAVGLGPFSRSPFEKIRYPVSSGMGALSGPAGVAVKDEFALKYRFDDTAKRVL